MLVYGKCECFVKQMLYECDFCVSSGSCQCCVLYDLNLLMLVEDSRGDDMEEAYFRADLMTAFLCSHECLLLFTPSCCDE